VIRWVTETLRGRILMGLGILLSGLLVVSVVGVQALAVMRRTVSVELGNLRTSSEVGGGLVTAVFDEIRAAEQYLTIPSPQARLDFQNAADQAFIFEKGLDRLEGLTSEDRLTINRLRQLQATIQVDYALAHALKDLGRTGAATAASADVRQPASELTRLVRDFSGRQSSRAAQAESRLADLASGRQLVLWIWLSAVVLVAIGASLWTLRGVEAPLGRLTTAAERFGAGDLRPVTTGQMLDEFRILADAMRVMGERLRGIVGEVISASDRIAGSASDLSAVTEQLAASSGEVSTAMVEIASGADQQRNDVTAMERGLEHLHAAAADMAAAASQVARLGDEIRTVANRHRGDVAAAGSALLDVREVVRTTSQHVGELAHQSEAIDDFVGLIKRISSQTNLLALNAAIEAARAGEHGRGFAVVAEEVRQLADESARAAEEVAHTTAVFREQVDEVTATMSAGQAKVRGIEAVAEGAARGLAEIITAIEQVEQAAAHVMRAAQENRHVSEDLRQKAEGVAGRSVSHASSAEEVTAAAEEQGASTQEMAASAGELLQAAEKLRALVKGFRV